MKKSVGFTMLELLIAIAIGLVLYKAAFGDWSSNVKNVRANAAVEALSTCLRQARVQAMETGAVTTVTVNGSQILVSSANPSVPGKQVVFENGVSVSGVTSFSFNSNGIAQNNGTANFSNGRSLTVTLLGQVIAN